jgi:hypothetical protein
MAMVNTDHGFFMADIGTSGWVSDDGAIQNTKFYTHLQENRLNIPQ